MHKSYMLWAPAQIQFPKDTTKKLLELTNEFSKVAGYKINIQKSIAFPDINNKLSEEETRKKNPFTIASKRTKYLKINLPQDMKDLYLENYKTLMKEIKDDKQMGRYTMFLDWKF